MFAQFDRVHDDFPVSAGERLAMVSTRTPRYGLQRPHVSVSRFWLPSSSRLGVRITRLTDRRFGKPKPGFPLSHRHLSQTAQKRPTASAKKRGHFYRTFLTRLDTTLCFS